MELSGKNLIGSTLSAKGDRGFHAINPSNQQKMSTRFADATPAEIDEAVRLAAGAFEAYRNVSYNERATFLETIADEILATGDILIQTCMEETGLPEGRLTGERMRTVNQLRLFASVVRDGTWLDARIETADPGREPAPKPDIRSLRIPLGPVAVFGASNFPLAFSVAGGDTASALAAGCPVIVKAHPLHPGTSELVGLAILRAAEKSGMPEGAFSMIHGNSHEVGMQLVRHQGIRAVGFTGSFRGGKALFDAANSREVPIPVFAEMGSVNPVFVLPGAMKERGEDIARGLAQSVTLGVGQFCTNPGLLISREGGDGEQFSQLLAGQVEATDAGFMLSEQIRAGFLAGIRKLSGTQGVDQLAAGRPSPPPDDQAGHQVRPQVLTTTGKVFLAHKELEEEVFGPSTLNIRAESKDEIIGVAAQMGGHLTATIHGTREDLQEYAELVRVLELKVGRLIFNGYPTGVEVCHAMVHGGPFPATTRPDSTSVGTAAINRFARPVCFQDAPPEVLPEALKDHNPLGIWRLVNGKLTKDTL